MVQYSPVADPSVLNACTVISVDDGLLRTSISCADPSSSSTLYVDCPNCIVQTIDKVIVHIN